MRPRAEETEYDPAKVSESLKAIFQFGSAATKQSLNANTVTLISGTIGGTYVQFGADLASVLDDGNKLRVLPIVGRGSVQSVADILFLQGVDLGIVRSDTLDYLERKGFAKDIKKQFTYVTKLYNEEMHVIASKSVHNLRELEGKTVSVDLPNGGTFVTALTVFERLGIKPKVVYIEQRIALEKMQGRRNRCRDRFRRQAVQVRQPVQGRSLPSGDGRLRQAAAGRLSAGDPDRQGLSQPDFGPGNRSTPSRSRRCWRPITGRRTPTAIASSRSSWMHFFTKFPAFQNPPFHPKWKEVSLSAPLADWQRFPAAKQWLDQHNIQPVARDRFDEFLKQKPGGGQSSTRTPTGKRLFKQFQAWEAEQNAKAQIRPRAGMLAAVTRRSDSIAPS